MGGNTDFTALARFATTLDVNTLDAATLASARACLLYGLAVGIATLRGPTARPACALGDLDGAGSDGRATRLFDGRRLSAGDSALANAVLLSGRAQGDSHPAGHIGGVVIPAALATAELKSLSGAAFMASLIAGYEVALRIGRDHAADLSGRGFRTSPAYGVFGAATSAGLAFGFSASQIEAALGLSANLAGGLREYVTAGTEESPLQAGFAARNGIGAALIVAGGLTAAAGSALCGNAGFYRAFGSASADAPARRLNDRLGEQFEFTTVTCKPYPICQVLPEVVRGMHELRGQAGNATLESAVVSMAPFEAKFIGIGYQGPFLSAAQTLMSGPYCAALGWLTGTASYADIRNVDHPEGNAMARRISVVADASRKHYQPKLQVSLSDGRVLDWSAGDVSYTLTWPAAVKAAPALCAEMGISGAAVQALIDACSQVERLASVAPIVAAARAAIAASPYAVQD